MTDIKNIEADICVIGGGPIGLSCALAAATKLGLRVAVLETAPEFPAQYLATTPMDSRVYALSPASRALLEELGVWQTMAGARLQAVNSMRIWGDSAKVSHDVVSAPDLELAAPSTATQIATIVEHNNLLQSLAQRVQNNANITVYFSTRATAINMVESSVSIDFTADGLSSNCIKAKLLIGADGVNSWVRKNVGFEPVGADYSASAVVANFQCEKPHGYAARQWFLGQSVLALLPLPKQKVSMVWSCEHAHAGRLMCSTDLAQEVAAQHATIAHELGALTLLGTARKFPLSRRGAAQWVAPCVALLGDAAHSVHPLAGQGANLGFGDVVALIETLAACGKFSNIGDVSVLQRYQRARREHSLAVTLVTDGLYKVNRADSASAQWLRHEGLQIVNRSGLMKRAMMAAATR